MPVNNERLILECLMMWSDAGVIMVIPYNSLGVVQRSAFKSKDSKGRRV